MLAPSINGTYEQLWIGYSDRLQEGNWVDSDGNPPGIQNWGTTPNGKPLPDNAEQTRYGVHERQN